MKFSVIIPIYNTEKFLCKCLDSVINQTHTDLEIIIVNDGSPGNADEICRDYAAKDSRIKYIRQENQGVSVARNNGLAAAAGDYIYFLDNDDSIAPDFFEKINDTLIVDPADIFIVHDICFPLVYAGTCITWEFGVRHEFLKKYPDIRYSPGVQPCEDSLFYYQLSSLTDHITLCKKAKYFYNTDNPESVSKNLSNQRHLKSCYQSFEVVSAFHDRYKLEGEKATLHLTAFMKSIYAIFLAVSDRTTKNKILTATQKFIKKYPLARLNEREKIYFQKDFEYFVKSRIYEEYLLRKFMGHVFGITHREDVRQHQIIIRIFGVKITFSHKKDNQ